MDNLNESLLQFKVYDNQLGGLPGVQHEVYSKHKKMQTIFYVIGLLWAQVTWIIISFNFSQHIPIQAILFIALSWVIIWSTIGYKNKFLFLAQYIFWLQACFHTFMFAMAKAVHNHHFILCGCSMGVIFFIIVEIIAIKQLVSSKIFFYLYIWYGLAYYSNMKKIQYMSDTNWLMMLMLYIYCLYGIVVYVLLVKKWSKFSKFGKFQAIILLYPLSIIFVFCIAGSFPQRSFKFKWNWFTIINHAVFIYIMYFIFKNKQLLPCLTIQNNQLQPFDNREILYQNSDTLLVEQADYVGDGRQSMKGSPPLALCTFCQDKQSCFCYFNCKHAVVCPDCAHDWLLNSNMRKCPFCRTQSDYLQHIQRISGVIFVVNGKYRFKKN